MMVKNMPTEVRPPGFKSCLFHCVIYCVILCRLHKCSVPLTHEEGVTYLLVWHLVSMLTFISVNTLCISTYVLLYLSFLCKSIFFVHLFVGRLQTRETHIVFVRTLYGEMPGHCTC